jgi:DNA-binding NarL/FixJ family response regulator
MRVVIADDEVLLREGLERLLAETGFDVVGKAGSPEELLRTVALARPDVAIIDIRMPPSHTDEGIVAAQQIGETHPGVGVLVLRTTSIRAMPCASSNSTRAVSATCSKSVSRASACSPTPPTIHEANPSSTQRSSLGSWTGTARRRTRRIDRARTRGVSR